MLDDALREIDDEIVPAMREILERKDDLAGHLALYYERGELPLPEPAQLARLTEIHNRQRRAITACVQQAANAEATLEAILQERTTRWSPSERGAGRTTCCCCTMSCATSSRRRQ